MDKAERKQVAAASTWRRSSRMEQLLGMRAESLDRFESVITPGLRIALAHYERAKAAAAAEGIDTGGDA